jgi:hypothetical protein
MNQSHHKVPVGETSNIEGQLCLRVALQNHQPLMHKISKLMRILLMRIRCLLVKLALIRMNKKTFMERLTPQLNKIRSFERAPKLIHLKPSKPKLPSSKSVLETKRRMNHEGHPSYLLVVITLMVMRRIPMS